MFEQSPVQKEPSGIQQGTIDFGALSYDEILNFGKLRFYSFKTVKEEYLAMLLPKRKELRGKGGEGKWAAFVRDLDGPSLKTLNTHLDRFEENGCKKPAKISVQVDPTKVVVRNVSRDRDTITFEVFLPEHNKSYRRSIRT